MMFVQGDTQKSVIAKAALQSKLSNDGQSKISKGALYEGNLYLNILVSLVNFEFCFFIHDKRINIILNMRKYS